MVDDLLSFGGPSTSITDEITLADRRVSIKRIAADLNISLENSPTSD